jgi:hypothetical protein
MFIDDGYASVIGGATRIRVGFSSIPLPVEAGCRTARVLTSENRRDKDQRAYHQCAFCYFTSPRAFEMRGEMLYHLFTLFEAI